MHLAETAQTDVREYFISLTELAVMMTYKIFSFF
jgi:hypothetical protein